MLQILNLSVNTVERYYSHDFDRMLDKQYHTDKSHNLTLAKRKKAKKLRGITDYVKVVVDLSSNFVVLFLPIFGT